MDGSLAWWPAPWSWLNRCCTKPSLMERRNTWHCGPYRCSSARHGSHSTSKIRGGVSALACCRFLWLWTAPTMVCTRSSWASSYCPGPSVLSAGESETCFSPWGPWPVRQSWVLPSLFHCTVALKVDRSTDPVSRHCSKPTPRTYDSGGDT